MKKIISALAISLLSLNVHATTDTTVTLKALDVYLLNLVSDNSITFDFYSGGVYSAGICRFVIRGNYGSNLLPKFMDRFDVTHSITGLAFTKMKPKVIYGALLFPLMQTDYSYERVTIASKDGKSISENVKAFWGQDLPLAVLLDSCLPRDRDYKNV